MITIALAKGRLLEPSLRIFESLGYDLSEARDSRKLVIDDPARGARFLIAKPMDVPIYVEYGAADAGIVGQDALRESGVHVYEPLALEYGSCRLVVAGKSEFKDVEWRLLAGLRVATKYPRLTKQYFSARGLSSEIIEVYGSVELAPMVGLADLIVDVVDTGRTLRENGLVELDEIFKSQAALIVNRASHTLKVDEIRVLIDSIAGCNSLFAIANKELRIRNLMTTTKIPIIVGASAGRAKILRNRGLLDKEISSALADGLHKTFGEPLTPEQAVARIITDVRARGDASLLDWTRKLDGVTLPNVVVSQDEVDAAYAETPAAVREALEFAADRVRAFHEKQKPKSWLAGKGEAFARLNADSKRDFQFREDENASDDLANASPLLGQRVIPLARVGVYVPGGTAPLPSSLLMAAIPAQVAGVREIVVATPPMKSGHIQIATLAAAKIAGVSRVFAMGGAQGIAALAFGTETVARVDKIVGPGGLFVTLAKRQVFGAVGIDGLYGPTETLLIADDSANPAWCAADMLAQAEHDEFATSLLITTSRALADGVAQNLESQLSELSRRDIIAKSLEGQGAIVVVETLDEAMELANAFGPEHMCLLVREPWNWIGKVENAGGVFVGEWTNEALGDYVIGPSHVMPTAGTARFTSALNVNDFVKITNVFSVSAQEAHALGERAATLAEAEGLTAHANAIRRRMTNDG